MNLPKSKDELIGMLVHVKSNVIYVILVKDNEGKPTLVVDPGTHLPYKNENKRVADYMAKLHGGEARTWKDAWSILIKAHPTLEKSLLDNLQKVSHGKR